MKQIESSREIKKILHVPINVAIVCLIFFHFSELPDKLTKLYTLLCLRLILRHIIKRTPNEAKVQTLDSLNDLPQEISKEFLQLCYIAFEGMYNNKIIFSSKDLRDMNVMEDKISRLGLLLVAPSMSVCGIRKSYNFLHMTLQEFCAAWYISNLSTEEQIKHFNSYLNYDEHRISSHMVWRFYSGITKLRDFKVVRSMWPCKSVVSPFVNDKLLILMKLIYEADNSSLCQTLGDYFCGIIDIYDSDFFDEQYNAYALSYFLIHYKGKIVSLDLRYLGKRETEILVFKSLENRLSMNEAIFPSVKCIGDDIFSKFLNLLAAVRYHVAELHICENYQETHMKILLQILCNSKTLKVLWIESDKFGLKGALSLADCRNIVLQDLRLPSCKIGSKGAGGIGEMISYNNSIESVNLSFNEIDDFGMKCLVHHLQKNNTLQSLDLQGNWITAIGALSLREIINTLSCIKLSGFYLGHVGIYLALKAITVPLKHIELTGRHVSYCYRSIAAILDKVRSVSFIAPGDDEGYEVICESLAKATILEQLEIVSDIKNLYNHKLLLNAIEQNDNIKTLQICYQEFTDKYATDLAKFIRSNKSLTSLSFNCSEALSPQGFLLIADSLTENTSITDMAISNWLFDEISPNFVLEFLYQLKQANQLKWLWICMQVYTYRTSRIDFYKKVDMSIQQINYSRSIKGIDPLKLDLYTY